MKPIVAIFFATFLYTRCEPGYCQRQVLVDLGPRNVTRFENEANVYIPCPFPGSSNPIWRINGIDYEAFNLPLNMLPVSYGLLIPVVELGMDGKSFQCILQTDEVHQLMSDIGILKVEKVLPEYIALYQEDNAAIQTPFSSTSTSFSLDHQKTFFGPDFKTFSWNRDTSVGCNHYRVTSVDCNGNTQRIWDQDVIQEASVAIPSSFVIDDHNHPLYFMIQSVNENGAECNRLPVDFAVNQSDITETQSTSYHGTCTNVESEGGPAVVLPSKTLGNDCPCSIVLTTNNDYTLTNCSCASDTIFRDSFYVSKQMTTSNTYKTCLYNLTREMNNTVIHFYDLYRECTNRDGEERTKAFRMYLKSLKIVIELPYQPRIMVNTTSGEVIILSDAAEGIELDHYKITLSDNTNLTVYHRTVPGDGNGTSFGTLFQQRTCSPYNLTVSAYSVLGNSVSTTNLIGTSEDNGECNCIREHVDVDLELIEVSGSGIGVQVNCSQSHYEDSVNLQIQVREGSFNISEPFTAVCSKKEVTPRIIKSLECDKAYYLAPYWMTEKNIPCYLYDTNTVSASHFLKKVSCKGSGIDTTAAIAGSVPSFVVLVLLVVFVGTIICQKCKKKPEVRESLDQ